MTDRICVSGGDVGVVFAGINVRMSSAELLVDLLNGTVAAEGDSCNSAFKGTEDHGVVVVEEIAEKGIDFNRVDLGERLNRV